MTSRTGPVGRRSDRPGSLESPPPARVPMPRVNRPLRSVRRFYAPRPASGTTRRPRRGPGVRRVIQRSSRCPLSPHPNPPPRGAEHDPRLFESPSRHSIAFDEQSRVAEPTPRGSDSGHPVSLAIRMATQPPDPQHGSSRDRARVGAAAAGRQVRRGGAPDRRDDRPTLGESRGVASGPGGQVGLGDPPVIEEAVGRLGPPPVAGGPGDGVGGLVGRVSRDGPHAAVQARVGQAGRRDPGGPERMIVPGQDSIFLVGDPVGSLDPDKDPASSPPRKGLAGLVGNAQHKGEGWGGGIGRRIDLGMAP